MSKSEYFCRECGGTNVSAQGWVTWDKDKSDWVYESVHEDVSYDWCNDCEDEIRGDWRDAD